MTVYRVTEVVEKEPVRATIVIAQSQAQAIRHVVGHRFTAAALTTRELADAVLDGAKIEHATKDSE